MRQPPKSIEELIADAIGRGRSIALEAKALDHAKPRCRKSASSPNRPRRDR